MAAGEVYQTNCTFYDALGRDDRGPAARLLQLFVPGIPQVYYVGLLGAQRAVPTGDAREINRRRYTDARSTALEQPVVRGLLELLRLRTHTRRSAGLRDRRGAGRAAVLASRHGEATAALRATCGTALACGILGVGAAWSRTDADLAAAG